VIWLQHFLAKIDKHFGGRVGKNQHRSCNVFGDACVSLCGYYFNRFGYLSSLYIFLITLPRPLRVVGILQLTIF
jgi:hypothetical protein